MTNEQPGKILIVDDEAPLMTALCNTLKDEGYETTGVSSGKAALEALGKEKFELLLTDLMMPEMDGMTLLRAALEADPQLACVMMTGEGTIATAVQAMKSGALDYILKPFKLGMILPVLSRALAIRRLRIENAELQESVRARTVELEAANKELEAFCYSVSHDLRAPVRHIGGYADLLGETVRTKLDEKEGRHLDKIISSAGLLSRLIDDLLRLSRLGRQALARQPVNVAKMARGIVDELKADEPTRDIEVRVGELPDCVGDPGLLRQAFVNLLSNAFKFTRGKKKAKIEIGFKHEGADKIYFVRDNGAGFAMNHADRLFGVFQRLHPAEQFDGNGVGLSIVQRIVQRHGGRAWAEGEVDKGATFYLTVGE